MSNRVLREIELAARQAPQMYFAPIIGVVRGLREQYSALNKRYVVLERPSQKRRKDEAKNKTATS